MEFRFENPKQLHAHLDQSLKSFNTIHRKLIERPDDVDAAVLALFGLDQKLEPSVLITKRTDKVEKHKGQMAFPGGHCEPDDFKREGHITTALRETHEEVGIASDHIQIVSKIAPFSTPTGFRLHPVVGVLQTHLEQVPLMIDPHETAEAFWVPLKTLIDPQTYQLEEVEYQGRPFPIHVFQVGPHRIWGATGAILHHVIRAAFSTND